MNADWATPSLTRHRLARWLQDHGWSTAQTGDLVLAISEAVSNSVEHGYGVALDTVDHPGMIELHGRIVTGADGHRRAEFSVRDEGGWREPDDRGSRRSRGLQIMRSCVDELTVDGTPAGTTVVLRSLPIPAAPDA